jgi:hypothetical protein
MCASLKTYHSHDRKMRGQSLRSLQTDWIHHVTAAPYKQSIDVPTTAFTFSASDSWLHRRAPGWDRARNLLKVVGGFQVPEICSLQASKSRSRRQSAGSWHRPPLFKSQKSAVRCSHHLASVSPGAVCRFHALPASVDILKPKTEPEPNPNRPNYRSIRIFGFRFGSYMCYILGYEFGFGS